MENIVENGWFKPQDSDKFKNARHRTQEDTRHRTAGHRTGGHKTQDTGLLGTDHETSSCLCALVAILKYLYRRPMEMLSRCFLWKRIRKK